MVMKYLLMLLLCSLSPAINANVILNGVAFNNFNDYLVLGGTEDSSFLIEIRYSRTNKTVEGWRDGNAMGEYSAHYYFCRLLEQVDCGKYWYLEDCPDYSARCGDYEL